MSISAITDRRVHIQPSDVHNVLSRHMLADGYDVVMDLTRSKGSWLFDARRGRALLDFFTNFASVPNETQYFPKFHSPLIDNPALTCPIDTDHEQREHAAIAQAKQSLAERTDDVAAFIMEPVQGEGCDNHFRPEFFRAVRQMCHEH